LSISGVVNVGHETSRVGGGIEPRVLGEGKIFRLGGTEQPGTISVGVVGNDEHVDGGSTRNGDLLLGERIVQEVSVFSPESPLVAVDVQGDRSSEGVDESHVDLLSVVEAEVTSGNTVVLQGGSLGVSLVESPNSDVTAFSSLGSVGSDQRNEERGSIDTLNEVVTVDGGRLLVDKVKVVPDLNLVSRVKSGGSDLMRVVFVVSTASATSTSSSEDGTSIGGALVGNGRAQGIGIASGNGRTGLVTNGNNGTRVSVLVFSRNGGFDGHDITEPAGKAATSTRESVTVEDGILVHSTEVDDVFTIGGHVRVGIVNDDRSGVGGTGEFPGGVQVSSDVVNNKLENNGVVTDFSLRGIDNGALHGDGRLIVRNIKTQPSGSDGGHFILRFGVRGNAGYVDTSVAQKSESQCRAGNLGFKARPSIRIGIFDDVVLVGLRERTNDNVASSKRTIRTELEVVDLASSPSDNGNLESRSQLPLANILGLKNENVFNFIIGQTEASLTVSLSVFIVNINDALSFVTAAVGSVDGLESDALNGTFITIISGLRVLLSKIQQLHESVTSSRRRAQGYFLKKIVHSGNAVRTILAKLSGAIVTPLHVEGVVVSLESQLIGSGESQIISELIKSELGHITNLIVVDDVGTIQSKRQNGPRHFVLASRVIRETLTDTQLLAGVGRVHIQQIVTQDDLRSLDASYI